MEPCNNKKSKTILGAGLLFTAVLGTLSHFFWKWSGENNAVALFSPVNESIWEHMKLVFFPVLLWSFLLPGSVKASCPDLRLSVQAGGIVGTFSVPVLFYTYSGILGYTAAAIDIGIFFAADGIAFSAAAKLNQADRISEKHALIGILSALTAVLFFLFTFYPPDIGLFAVP